MKRKFLSRDYKEDLANIVETKKFSEEACNLLLSMTYRIDDGYANYEKVKREVPEKEEFFQKLIDEVEYNCENILIAIPGSKLEEELKANKCKMMMEDSADSDQKTVISYPNVKTLLYGITKASLPKLGRNLSIEDQAVLTAINIGKCISTSEILRDFNGWTWSISENEIESIECNIIYIFLSYLFGYDFLEDVTIEKIKNNVPQEFYEVLKKVATQFYMSYDKTKNEEILKRLSDDKKLYEKMKNRSQYVTEITETKKNLLLQIRRIDELISNPMFMKQEYLAYNSKLPNEKKIFSVSHYAEMIEHQRNNIMEEMNRLTRMQNPNEFLREKERIQYEIKFYEDKTDITKLQKEFLKLYLKKLELTDNKWEMLDILYEIRYLNFLPNGKMNLNEIIEKAIPKAIKLHVISPISNNNILDYRILKGIFDTQVISLENLYIRISFEGGKLNVELLDGDVVDRKYDVQLPDGADVEIRSSRRTKIFEI